MAAPALMQMAIPNLIANAQNPQNQGNAIIQAALKQQQGQPGGAQPLIGPNGLSNNGLLSKFFPNMSGAPGAAPIDPNSGLPVTPDVMAGAAAMGGPPAPSPTALTGLW